MVTILELIELHEINSYRFGWKDVLGDPFLIENCHGYQRLREAIDSDTLIQIQRDDSAIEHGWPLYRVSEASSNVIKYFDNSGALKSVLLAMGENHPHFTTRTFNYKDILGNTIAIEFVMARAERFLTAKMIHLEPATRKILLWIFGFAVETWIGLSCHTTVAKWYGSLNLYFRELGQIRSVVEDDLDEVQLIDFLEVHLFEFSKLLYDSLQNQETSRGAISPLSQVAFNHSQGALTAISNLILEMRPLAASDLRSAFEDMIEVCDNEEFRNCLRLRP